MVVGATKIHERCLGILGELVGARGEDLAEISLDDDMESVFALDSMDAYDLILAAEEEFAIRIPDEAFDDVRTLRQFEAAVEAGLKEREVS